MTHVARFSSVLVAVLVAVACGGDPTPTPVKIDRAAASEDNAAEVADESVAPSESEPRITADAAVHDFGPIKGTDALEHVFKIRNAGGADLVIDRVQKT